MVYEVQDQIGVDTNTLDSTAIAHLHKRFRALGGRRLLSIFEELGLPMAGDESIGVAGAEVSLHKVLADRRALDQVIFEALGLTEQEQLEVYRAVLELVKNRLAKARSV